MIPTSWNREKRTGSGGRIVSLLAKGRRTVEDLAGTLGINEERGACAARTSGAGRPH